MRRKRELTRGTIIAKTMTPTTRPACNARKTGRDRSGPDVLREREKMKIMKCETCSKNFRGTKAARYCPACRKKRQREAVYRWFKEHKERYAAIRSKYFSSHKEEINAKRRKNNLQPESGESEKMKAPLSKCANYRSDSVSCVLCMDTGAELFKACFKK